MTKFVQLIFMILIKKFVRVIVAYNPNFNNICKLKSLVKTLTSLIVSEEEV